MEALQMYLALEKKMSPEQRRVLEEWERTNCVQEAVGLQPAFQNFCSVAEQHVDAMRALGKPTLEEVCLSVAARENSVWGGVCRPFALRHPHETFNEQEKGKWKELEERICVDDSPCSNSLIVSCSVECEECSGKCEGGEVELQM